MTKQITVRATTSRGDIAVGWDVEDTHMETVKQAKERAKYLLTVEYRDVCEASECLNYSQVVVNGEVLHDYFN